MEYIKWLQENLHIDPIVVLIVIASGFFQNRYLSSWVIGKDTRASSALKTLLVSFVVCVIYLYLAFTPRNAFANYFLSYFLATSLYELILRPLIKWINKGKDIDNENNPKP